MIPIEQLVRSISTEDLFELMLDGLESVKVPARSWRKGGTARTIISYLASFGSQGSEIVSSAIAGMFLLFARGDYLTNHAEDVYGVKRIKATFASAPDAVVLSNVGGAVYPVNANELILRSTNVAGARYRVVSRSDGVVPFDIPAATFAGGVVTPGTVTVAVEAITAGAASSVGPAELDDLETPLAKVTVSNTKAIVGRDAEGDDALVDRCLAKRATWSPFGPRDAYAYAALTATLPGGSPTNVTRVAVSRFSSTGRVTVVCATPSGTPTGPELDAVRTLIEKIARPDTVTVTVLGATTVETTHAMIVWARGGTEAIIRQRATQAMNALIETYPIGGIAKIDATPGKLWADLVASAVIASSPEIFDVDFVGGAVDITLGASEVATNTTTFDIRVK